MKKCEQRKAKIENIELYRGRFLAEPYYNTLGVFRVLYFAYRVSYLVNFIWYCALISCSLNM